MTQYRSLGAVKQNNGTWNIRVWAPKKEHVFVLSDGQSFPMQKEERGYFFWNGTLPVPLYQIQVEGSNPMPDPVSLSLPEGIHGKTELVDPLAFNWEDQNWKGLPLSDAIIYELHLGTFTKEGTLLNALEKLPYLKELGITVIELMPLSSFSGKCNWGYDGVAHFAVHKEYGTVKDLATFVNEAHKLDLAVCLDVVYNHFGPEGNYLKEFGPYFTEKYRTPWGEALNYDEAYSNGARDYVLENVRYWLEDLHIDYLRLDAIHGIFDQSATHILADVSSTANEIQQRTGVQKILIGECDRSDPKYVQPKEWNGMGLDGVWADDFHHAIHTTLTNEQKGYYSFYKPLHDLADIATNIYKFRGEYYPQLKMKHGKDPKGIEAYRFIGHLQNHDQTGNRAFGERLNHLVSKEAYLLSVMTTLLHPMTPLLFMGQEWASSSPFQYFVDHRDKSLREIVSKGRRQEFKDFDWTDVPDPADAKTFKNSKLNWEELNAPEKNEVYLWHKKIISLRKEFGLSKLKIGEWKSYFDENGLLLSFFPLGDNRELLMVANWSQINIKYNPQDPSQTKLLINSISPFENKENLVLPQELPPMCGLLFLK